MENNSNPNYWLFQSHPKVFKLPEALRDECLGTFAIKAHRDRIKVGDRVILWMVGPQSGCYGLARVASEVKEMAVLEREKPYFTDVPAPDVRVELAIEYNLWNKPITKELIPAPPFDQFYAGTPGTNFTATATQYNTIIQLIEQLDLANEPTVDYAFQPYEQPPLNMILYGPPGTGKTYQTIIHALSIVEHRSKEELALEDRQVLRQRFNEYLGIGQIAFVTFHQSFSYEDFVEGIKPVVTDGQINYQVQDGIFKIICQDAHRCMLEAYLKESPQENVKVEFNKLYKAFLQFVDSDAFDYFESLDGRRIFLHKILNFGNLAIRPARSFAVQQVQKQELEKLYFNLTTLEEDENPEEAVRDIIQTGDAVAYWAVFRSLKSFEEQLLQVLEVNEEAEKQPEPPAQFELPVIPNHLLARCKKYVLIIDEINRGNLSGIFGELITLLEPDKREGRQEALRTILPYSKSYFMVPPNLYLIGTMNSTDRSTSALDLALRRRFTFKTIRPDATILTKPSDQPLEAGVSLDRLLSTINHRIALLLGEDYAVGHSYFLKVQTLADLKMVFEYQIVPLLKEYFFNDYGKIGLVLGKAFLQEHQPLSSSNGQVGFADFDHPYMEDLTNKTIFTIRPMEELEEADFIRIYKG